MAERITIGLDNPVFQGRLRQPGRPLLYSGKRANYQLPNRPVTKKSELSNTGETTQQSQASAYAPPQSSIYPEPSLEARVQPIAYASATSDEIVEPAQKPLSAFRRLAVKLTAKDKEQPTVTNVFRHLSKVQIGLIGMAAVVFMLGVFASLQTIKTNHSAAAQVAVLGRKANNPANVAAGSVVPSSSKPTPAAINNYEVAPAYPRYLIIPKLGVRARVLQVGVTSSGALGTPPNIYDTAWYNGSAEPGQPGATLIDGHVSSWTSHGVFYGLNTLKPGDAIQIVQGDGTVILYQVVKTQIYNAKDVDMQAAITPITPGTSGLNLISCTGDVIPGTSQFNERIIVFAQPV